MEPGETFELNQEIRNIVRTILEWLKERKAQGGTVAELDAYEQSINWSGDHLAKHLMMSQYQKWFKPQEGTERFFITSDGEGFLETLKWAQ